MKTTKNVYSEEFLLKNCSKNAVKKNSNAYFVFTILLLLFGISLIIYVIYAFGINDGKSVFSDGIVWILMMMTFVSLILAYYFNNMNLKCKETTAIKQENRDEI